MGCDAVREMEFPKNEMIWSGAELAEAAAALTDLERRLASRHYDAVLYCVEESPPGYILNISITSAGGTRTERRKLPEAPVMTLNLSRVLASGRAKIMDTSSSGERPQPGTAQDQLDTPKCDGRA